MRRLNVGVLSFVFLFGTCLWWGRGCAEERYVVKEGDTLAKISRSFGVSVDALKKANRLQKDAIRPKQTLVVPVPKKAHVAEAGTDTLTPEGSYIVKKGDTLFSISRKTGVPVEDLRIENPVQSAALRAGHVLFLPRTRPALEEEPKEPADRGEADASLSKEEKGNEPAGEPLAKWSGSEERNLFIKVAMNFLGVPYRLGGSTLRGIDCSAFVKKIYEIFNVSLPRTTREQLGIGKAIRKEDLEQGDLVFFDAQRGASVSHVGIYIGNMKFVHASSQDKEVKVDRLDMPYFNKHFLRGVRIKEMQQDS